MIKVGQKKGDGRSIWGYAEIPNKDGWVDPEKYLPVDYDLCMVLTEKNKQCSAWHVMNFWEGYRLSPNDKVIAWKRKLE